MRDTVISVPNPEVAIHLFGIPHGRAGENVLQAISGTLAEWYASDKVTAQRYGFRLYDHLDIVQHNTIVSDVNGEKTHPMFLVCCNVEQLRLAIQDAFAQKWLATVERRTKNPLKLKPHPKLPKGQEAVLLKEAKRKGI